MQAPQVVAALPTLRAPAARATGQPPAGQVTARPRAPQPMARRRVIPAGVPRATVPPPAIRVEGEPQLPVLQAVLRPAVTRQEAERARPLAAELALRRELPREAGHHRPPAPREGDLPLQAVPFPGGLQSIQLPAVTRSARALTVPVATCTLPIGTWIFITA
jgi:hypothetical protein